MHTSSAARFERVVSSPRLDSYRRFFKATTIDEAIGLYLWNGEVSACFASHIAYFEIALRNSVHRAMSCFYSRGQHASCHWYDLIWQKRGVDRFRRRRNKPHPQALTPHEFRHRFPLLGRANQPIKLRRAGTSGVFVPD